VSRAVQLKRREQNVLSVTLSRPGCGNGYCDEWAGEDARTCPADCGESAPTLPRWSDWRPRAHELDHWKPGDAVPPGFRVQSRPLVSLVVGGSLALATGYVWCWAGLASSGLV
jgi:hypothetical protein